MRNPHGCIIITEPGKQDIEMDTFRCVHCGAHKPVIAGQEYGWCPRCSGPHCGASCDRCVPFERWLEQVERNGRQSQLIEYAK